MGRRTPQPCPIGLSLGVYVQSDEARDCLSLLAAGAGAVIGHNWPVYFGFKGGKGALTAAAVMFMFNWLMALISLGLFVVVIAATRYVSLGAISASIFFVRCHSCLRLAAPLISRPSPA